MLRLEGLEFEQRIAEAAQGEQEPQRHARHNRDEAIRRRPFAFLALHHSPILTPDPQSRPTSRAVPLWTVFALSPTAFSIAATVAVASLPHRVSAGVT